MADIYFGFGFMMFIGNGTYQHTFVMESVRKQINNTVAELFCREILLQQGRYDKWQTATDEVREATIKDAKWRIEPVAFKITALSTGDKFFDYTILRHALDADSGRGGGGIPEKYWEKELTIFREEDLTEYFEKSVEVA